MILFARAILAERPGATIVGEVKCSFTLYDDIAKHGGRAIMWKAGHSLIKAKMKEEHAELAGEMSGHIFFGHRWLGFDDGIYSSAPPAGAPLPHRPAPLGAAGRRARRPSPPRSSASTARRRRSSSWSAGPRPGSPSGYQAVTVDGVRVVFPDGWGLVRASNTQPILVLRFEATTEARLAEIRALVEGPGRRGCWPSWGPE